MDNRRTSQLRAFTARVLGLFLSRKRDWEFDAEMQTHLQFLVDRFVAQGMSQGDAMAAARRQFGNTTLLQEDRRELWTLVSVEDLGRDLRYALRSLGRSRAFAAVAIATLGLGIVASTAIFSVIDNVLLEPFAYKDPGCMVFLQIHGVRKVDVRDTTRMNFWNLPSRTTFLTVSLRRPMTSCSTDREKASSCMRDLALRSC